MADGFQGFVEEAKKNKFSNFGSKLSDEDIASVWENVSGFIEKQMALMKGVTIPGFGTFTFTQNKIDVGNNKYILMQRPVFVVSEKFAQNHGLQQSKPYTLGQIPVVQLNYAAIAYESPFDRDTVEACIKELLGAMGRSVSSKKNVEFVFKGIGRLQIRDSKLKMKFYKEYVNSMDGSGQLVECMKNRPGTVDSVMSNRTPTRNGANTVVLPRISKSNGLLAGNGEDNMPVIHEDQVDDDPAPREPVMETCEDPDAELTNLKPDGEDFQESSENNEDGDAKQEKPHSKPGSRMAAPIAQATGVSFIDDLLPPNEGTSPRSNRGTPMKSSPTPMMLKRTLSPIQSPAENGMMLSKPPPLTERPEFERARSVDYGTLRFAPSPPQVRPATPPRSAGSSCGHNAGQELCYLCHQRDRRNIPISFTEERKKRELEEDRLLQQYQHLKDTEAILGEQESLLLKRHENQKMSAFNLGVSEAIQSKKNARDLNFHPSYVFQKRPLTPPRFISQEKYSSELNQQVKAKDNVAKKQKADEEFLERLEQVQLAEDLAAQREQYWRDRFDQQEMYKKALSAQVRCKPLPIPARLPDSLVFGKNDMNAEKMAEKRARAHQLYQEQLATTEARKREAILKQLSEQKEGDDMLRRNKEGLLEDRADRYERLFNARKQLEIDWAKAREAKKQRDLEERLLTRDPGALVHEQCDKYKRCGQCQRRLHNCGETNLWCESRYIPGSRLIV